MPSSGMGKRIRKSLMEAGTVRGDSVTAAADTEELRTHPSDLPLHPPSSPHHDPLAECKAWSGREGSIDRVSGFY